MRDPWALYVIGQRRIETWIMPEPVGIQMKVRMASESGLYPDHPLGRYLRSIMPNPNNPNHQKVRGLFDPTTVAAIISEARALGWFSQVERVNVGVPDPYMRWNPDNDGSVHIIRAIDAEAMKKGMFDTLSGSPTPLIGASLLPAPEP